MTMDLKEKYISLATTLFYNKHFYKLILEKKYIEHFGDIELIKMKNIYDSMIINKKLEENFSMANDNSVQYNILVEYRAKKEFFDLKRQIKELENNIMENAKILKELELFLAKDMENAIRTLVSKTSPFVTKNKKDLTLFTQFIKDLNKGNWKQVLNAAKEAKNFRVLKTDLSEEEISEEIKNLESQIVSLKNRFPFTKLEILKDEKSIENLKSQESKDVKNMIESYQRMTDIYLSTSTTPEWFS